MSGELAASLTIWTLALREPEAVGEKETPTVQFAPGAIVLPQVLLSIRKSPGFIPTRLIDETVSVPSPVSVRVMV